MLFKAGIYLFFFLLVCILWITCAFYNLIPVFCITSCFRSWSDQCSYYVINFCLAHALPLLLLSFGMLWIRGFPMCCFHRRSVVFTSLSGNLSVSLSCHHQVISFFRIWRFFVCVFCSQHGFFFGMSYMSLVSQWLWQNANEPRLQWRFKGWTYLTREYWNQNCCFM